MFVKNLRKYLKNIDFLRFSWLLKEKTIFPLKLILIDMSLKNRI